MFRFHSSILNTINGISTRIDQLELSLKQDIATILDILHHQQQTQQTQHQQLAEKSVATHYQPSESDFSFDLGGVEKQQRTMVQRSISQPECANENEKSLLK